MGYCIHILYTSYPLLSGAHLRRRGRQGSFYTGCLFLRKLKGSVSLPGITCGAAGYQVNLHCENINSQADNFFISFRYTTIEASTIVYSV